MDFYIELCAINWGQFATHFVSAPLGVEYLKPCLRFWNGSNEAQVVKNTYSCNQEMHLLKKKCTIIFNKESNIVTS